MLTAVSPQIQKSYIQVNETQGTGKGSCDNQGKCKDGKESPIPGGNSHAEGRLLQGAQAMSGDG